jgi:transcriptional regulator with XRE-family HTH domain
MNALLEGHPRLGKNARRMAGKRKPITMAPGDPITGRVLLLQEVLDGGNRAAFGRRVGLTVQQLYNYEKMGQPVTLPALTQIKRGTGVTWEWLMEGDETTLRADLLSKIRGANPGSRRQA